MKIIRKRILEKDRRLHRCLSIFFIMQNGRKVEAQILANQFGVNKRSILRDLNALDVAGFALMYKINNLRKGRKCFWRKMR